MKKKQSLNFIEEIIEQDIQNGLPKQKLCFRFPPEPNGFLHIGHLKAIYINFQLAKEYNAPIHLRFDDTNPVEEDQIFVNAIKKDLNWLGFYWTKELYASDYFQQLYLWAIQLIKESKAYVDDQTSEQITFQRKNPFEPGIESPYRNRTIKENIILFNEMKNGNGNSVLRAKIDMNSPNMNMRDPVMYRIIHQSHHRQQKKWKIYPTYDWSHGQSDYIEGISHSLCSSEFENHRPLYEWYLNQIYNQSNIKSKQREFARLNLTHTITSKRKLKEIVKSKIVSGWDDPRMPTISGLRRRGYTPKSLTNFIYSVGVTKRENLINIKLLEFFVRQDLNQICERVMAVINPIKLVLVNYPDNKKEYIEIKNNIEISNQENRKIFFTKELYIEKEDFMEYPINNFFRLSIGKEVRLKGAYIIKAISLSKNKDGEINKIYATYDKSTKSGSKNIFNNRKIKSTIHWVSAKDNIPIKIRIYDYLFKEIIPDFDKLDNIKEHINLNSLKIINGFGEKILKNATINKPVQFQRLGYFIKDKDSTENNIIFNKTIGLKHM